MNVTVSNTQRAALLSMASGAGMPTLREGSRGSAVVTLQQKLKAAGFNPGAADGDFGPKTKAAVIAFQKSRHLVADGIVGPKTWAALGVKPPPPPPPGSRGSAALMVQKALAQKGDRYVFGAEVNLNDPNPSVFDCSELVEWAVHQAGGKIPDGSQNQRRWCRQHGLSISIDKALHTRGALLFTDGHVAISLGDGRTIEARGSKYGVGIFNAQGRAWKEAALIPGLKY